MLQRPTQFHKHAWGGMGMGVRLGWGGRQFVFIGLALPDLAGPSYLDATRSRSAENILVLFTIFFQVSTATDFQLSC
jgi:hypothetical protein